MTIRVKCLYFNSQRQRLQDSNTFLVNTSLASNHPTTTAHNTAPAVLHPKHRDCIKNRRLDLADAGATAVSAPGSDICGRRFVEEIIGSSPAINVINKMIVLHRLNRSHKTLKLFD
ncbi:hypothetical protein PoB_004551800 [Plakobranchus ocellatus]|uniref:Uncharacterized protein n=1 Tax=Plakobranchus ocellatus TaxID=259542 RepID=A0AAV4BHD6_9GAST|nr:hypothetical protein PoB_004551800 [Plakobranchus ocellatus]